MTRLHSPNMALAESLRRTNNRLDRLERKGQWISAYSVARMQEETLVVVPLDQDDVTLFCQIELPRGRWMIHGNAVYRQRDDEVFRGILGISESVAGGWPEFDAPIGMIDTSDAVDLSESSSWNSIAIATLSVQQTYLLEETSTIQLGGGRGGGTMDVFATRAHLIAIPG